MRLSGDLLVDDDLTVTGDVSGNLNASQLVTGTVPDARLSANVQMKPIPVGDLPPNVQLKPIAVGDLPASVQLKPIAAADLPAHAARHQSGGADPLSVVALAGYPGGTTNYLRADGMFAAPPGGGGDVFLNVANVFTQNQTISKTRPELRLVHTGATAPGRLTAFFDNEIRLTRNAYYDGTNWMLDDTTKTGAEFELIAGGLYYQTFAASANPATAVARMVIDPPGTAKFMTAEYGTPTLALPNSQSYIVLGDRGVIQSWPGEGISGTRYAHNVVHHGGIGDKNIINAGTSTIRAGADVVSIFANPSPGAAGTVFGQIERLRVDGSVSTYGAIYLGSLNAAANPSLYIWDGTQAVNSRMWRIMNQSSLLKFYKQDDGESGYLDCMHLDRSGNMIVAGYVSAAHLLNTPLNASNANSGTLPDARLSANVAMRSVDNTFATVYVNHLHSYGGIHGASYVNTAGTMNVSGAATFSAMTINGEINTNGGSGTGIHQSPIEIILAWPRVGFHWPGVVASSIGMDSDGTLRTFNNPGTGYERFACAYLYSSDHIYTASTSNSLGDLTVRGATNLQGGVTLVSGVWVYSNDGWQRLHFTWGGPSYLKGSSIVFRNSADTDIGSIGYEGNFTCSGNIGCATNIWRNNLHTTGYMYPGNWGAGTTQSSWLFAGHGSYGIYCNTGLYMEGHVWCNALYTRSQIAAWCPSSLVASFDTNSGSGSYISLLHNGAVTGYIGNGAALGSGAGDFAVRGVGQLALWSDTNVIKSGSAWATGYGGDIGNMYINSDTRFGRVTSSRRYKTDIKTWDEGDAVLKLRPVSYTSNHLVANPGYKGIGFISEEVAEIDPRFAQYDVTGQPEGLGWGAIIASAVVMIQKLHARIAALEAKCA